MALMKNADRGAKRSTKYTSKLRQLARHYGIQPFYTDVSGKRHDATDIALLSVLRALGAPVENIHDISDSLRERRQSIWNRIVEPVVPVWQETQPHLQLRLREESLGNVLSAYLQMESGEKKIWSFKPETLATVGTSVIEGTRYIVKGMPIAANLPIGYHDLSIDLPGGSWKTRILSAPQKAYSGERGEAVWGVFTPIYALSSGRNWGAGDFSDFEHLHKWLGAQGGQIVATLPFLAAFLGDDFFEPSPYSPASRLFWNEFYLDLQQIPEFMLCPEARNLMASVEQVRLSDLQSSSLVHYRSVMALKRKVLENLSTCFFDGDRPEAFDRFVGSNEAVEDYARFRATMEKRRQPWTEWPQLLRDGTLGPGDYDEKSMQYHLYAQWLAHEQVGALASRAREIGPGLYLDLPLGVNAQGYDTWRKRSQFPEGISAGAPPDLLFTKGQNWGFPPLHPENIRENGFEYVTDFLRRIMEQAGIIRIDHVMGLHRIFWVPDNMSPTEGVYVRYPAEELYAILSIESNRNKCRVVGENLGTVPGYVNESMSRHNIMKMYVVQYELEGNDPRVLRPVPSNVTASLNTHDMPPFAGFWNGSDIQDRHEIGLIKKAGMQRARKGRDTTKDNLRRFLEKKGWLVQPASEEAVLRGCLAYLSASAAQIVLVNLEDLWLETEPQNLPGTSGERPNWKRKAHFKIEEIKNMPLVLEILKEVDRLRKERTIKTKAGKVDG